MRSPTDGSGAEDALDRALRADLCAEMVRAGDTAHTACNKIYAAYGENLSVTKSIRKMQVDRRFGTWPA